MIFSHPSRADGVVDGAKHVVGAQGGNQPVCAAACCARLGLQPRDCCVDLALTRLLELVDRFSEIRDKARES
jgi:hypothetical protein